MPVDEIAFNQLQKRLEIVETKLALRNLLVSLLPISTPPPSSKT